jgi:hypothetical protein
MSGHGRNVVATLEVGDTDALYDQWSGQVEISGPPRNEDWGGRTFGLSDPFGNLLYVVGPVRIHEDDPDDGPKAPEQGN